MGLRGEWRRHGGKGENRQLATPWNEQDGQIAGKRVESP